MFVYFGPSRLELTQGDITRQLVDAIVNAANSALAGGGGVDGAIHAAAGPDIMAETRAKYPHGCPTGEAVVTGAGKLPIKHIIHTVGPVWKGGMKGEPELLAAACRHSLERAVENGCQSVAFPAISTGVYGYPKDLAAETSLAACRDFLIARSAPALVRFVLFDGGTFGAFARVLESMGPP